MDGARSRVGRAIENVDRVGWLQIVLPANFLLALPSVAVRVREAVADLVSGPFSPGRSDARDDGRGFDEVPVTH